MGPLLMGAMRAASMFASKGALRKSGSSLMRGASFQAGMSAVNKAEQSVGKILRGSTEDEPRQSLI